MSLIFSTTIKDKNIPKYKDLREYLKGKHMSIGDFIIHSYTNNIQNQALDETIK